MTSFNSDRKVRVRVNLSSLGDSTIISAPNTGAHIEIDSLHLLSSGGANTITLKEGASTIVDYDLDDNQAVSLDFPAHNPLELADNSAFVINLSAATKVTGLVIGRIVGEY